ncbi:uncharacterized protein [Montipora foliosa]|uniref:uncharacterized protein n=1 Tax=Montipora foliosa TaxID=591990 RepID=UPI0035F147B1
MIQILQTASQAKINILSMQEVRRTGKDRRSYDIINDTRVERWEVYWSGNDHKKTERVAITIKASPILQIARVHQENSRGMYMDVNYGGLKLRVQSLYAPTEQGMPHAKQKFYKMVETLNMLPSNDPHRKILHMGDFNASTSAALTRTCFKGDSFGEYENNENGDLFLQYCVEEKLQIIQTFFEHKWCHRVA